jgi:hypothetical protein
VRKAGLDLPQFKDRLCFGLSQVAMEGGRNISECTLSDTARLLDVIQGRSVGCWSVHPE